MSGDNILDLLDKYSITIGNASYPPILFIWVAFVLFIGFTIKTIVHMNINKRNKRKQNTWIYVSRQVLCYLFSIVVSFSLTCIFGNGKNILLHYIICPMIAYLAHIVFNNKILGPLELVKPNKQSKTDDSENSYDRDPKKLDDIIEKRINPDYINDDMTDSDDFNYIIKDRINRLIEFNRAAVVEYNKITDELKTQTNILHAISGTMKDELKLKLEKMIYQCLNQGYATPEQNKNITTMYQNYVSLGGNGEIQELYEKHYLKLRVYDGKKNQQKTRERK